VVAPDGGGGLSWLGSASRSLVTAGFAHPSGTTFGVSVFMGETPTRRDVPFSWFGFASVSLGIDALQMMLRCGWDLRGGRQFVSRIRRWIGCNGRAFIGNDSLKRSMSLWATATGAVNTFHSTTSEHGGVVSEPS
jgi:hypothetical protein